MLLGGRVKAIVRLLLMLIWTCSLFVVRTGTRLLAFVAPRLERRCRRGIFRLWGRGCLALLGGRVHVEGVPPTPPFLLVSNHLSYIDVVALGAVMGPVFVAKAEVGSWPLVGLLARSMQVIFINRELLRDVVRVKELVQHALDQGYGVHVFAEGGISQTCQVGEFKPALLDVAARSRHPVHYASVSYRTPETGPPPSKVVAWLAGKPFLTHLIELAASPGFEAILTFGKEPVVGEDRKALAEQLSKAVRDSYIPIK